MLLGMDDPEPPEWTPDPTPYERCCPLDEDCNKDEEASDRGSDPEWSLSPAMDPIPPMDAMVAGDMNYKNEKKVISSQTFD